MLFFIISVTAELYPSFFEMLFLKELGYIPFTLKNPSFNHTPFEVYIFDKRDVNLLSNAVNCLIIGIKRNLDHIMDIKRNKYLSKPNIKHLTLKATASAIFVLNTEAVIAYQTCPPQIVGNTLAGMICEFTANLSVSVLSGGTVGGIQMANYPPPVTPLFIAVDAGGIVSNSNANGIAIGITNSSLSKGISNSGTITSTGSSTTAGTATALKISGGSIVSSGIINSGTISTPTTVTPNSIALRVISSSVSGGINNKGVISSNQGTGVRIEKTSTISGGILNTGTINAGNNGPGIVIYTHSLIEGGITNAGLIFAAGNGDGVLIADSNISGNIMNSGTIQSVSSSGIHIGGSTITGNISNSGFISGNGDSTSASIMLSATTIMPI